MQRPCFVLVRQRRRPGRAITNATAIIATIITIMPPSRPGVRERGAGGSCAGKSEAIRALHSISPGHGVAPSRRENCRPGKRPVDHSKRQRWPRRTDPAPIHRRRHRIPARLNRRGTGANWRRDLCPAQGRSRCDVRELDRKYGRPPAGGLFSPVTLAWCEPREPLALGAPHPACDRSF